MNTSIQNSIVLDGNTSTTQTVTRTEIASAGIPLCLRNTNEAHFSIAPIPFSIKPGGALVAARVTLDDEGDLFIKDAQGNTIISLHARVDFWQKTEDPTHWQKTSATIFLPAGEYTVTGAVTNELMATAQNNLAYFRYEVLAQYTVAKGSDDADSDTCSEPQICNPCHCGNLDEP